MMISTTCPACDQEVELDDDLDLSEVILCPSCERELEVESIDPLVLAEFEEEEK